MELMEKQSYKQTEVGLIPEDWNFVKIQSLMDDKVIVSHLDGNHGALYPRSSEFTNNGVPYVTANDFLKGYLNFNNVRYLPISRAEQFQKGIAKNGDVLFAHNATVGPTAILKTDLDYVILSTTATYFRTDNNKLNNFYLRYFFESEFFVKQYSAVMRQSTRNQIPITQQRKFSVILPPTLEEQKAIATALSDVDELIRNLDQLITKKKAIKQGAMQQLLKPPHKGVKRLVGFSGEWVEKIVADVVEYKNGVAHENCVVENGKYVIVNSKFISTEGRVIKNSNKNLCPVSKNEILMVLSDIPNGKAIAKCYFVEENNKFTLNQRICSFKTEKADSKFLFLLLNRNPYYLQFDDGVKQTNLRNEDVLSCPLILPPTIEEQKQISKIIFDLDKDIKNSLVKRKKYQDIKQGMMQELLTGKTRLV